MRFLQWRNRILGSGRFQQLAARNPLLRPVARRRAAALFDLVAGFTYTQTLLAMVESGALERLALGATCSEQLAAEIHLSETATIRLLRAAVAIDLVEEAEPGWFVLGRHGAALQANSGAIAMIRHHRLLYADLTDPLALLSCEDRSGTRLAKFWRYAADAEGEPDARAIAAEYSQLMADSQSAVAQEVLASIPLGRSRSLLDVGGGSGTFLKHVAEAHPHLKLGLFDLPGVVVLARTKIEESATPTVPEFHGGDFFNDSLPEGYEIVTLVRILHDHDDEPAYRLLENIHRSMAPGSQLLIAEPMAGTPGAEGMGDAYFGLYLWAMGSGRPRSSEEIRAMLRKAGFRNSRIVRTNQAVVTSLIVATA